jgi:hypothetical protein
MFPYYHIVDLMVYSRFFHIWKKNVYPTIVKQLTSLISNQYVKL